MLSMDEDPKTLDPILAEMHFFIRPLLPKCAHLFKLTQCTSKSVLFKPKLKLQGYYQGYFLISDTTPPEDIIQLFNSQHNDM